MKKAPMKVDLIIYLLSTLLCSFAVSGINFDPLIKKGHVWEARFLSIIIILSLSYLVTNFVLGVLSINII